MCSFNGWPVLSKRSLQGLPRATWHVRNLKYQASPSTLSSACIRDQTKVAKAFNNAKTELCRDGPTKASLSYGFCNLSAASNCSLAWLGNKRICCRYVLSVPKLAFCLFYGQNCSGDKFVGKLLIHAQGWSRVLYHKMTLSPAQNKRKRNNATNWRNENACSVVMVTGKWIIRASIVLKQNKKRRYLRTES